MGIRLIEIVNTSGWFPVMPAPLFPLTICFCLGILTSHVVVYPLPALLLMDCLLLFCSWVLFILKKPACFPLAMYGTFAILGLTWTPISEMSYGSNHLKNLYKTGKLDLGQPCRVTGICTENKVKRGLGEQVELGVSKIENGFASFKTSGKVRLALYYAQTPVPFGLQPRKTAEGTAWNGKSQPCREQYLTPAPVVHVGEEVEILVNLRPATNFGNPGQFDYIAYLERQGVFLVGTVKSELLITKLGSGRGNWLDRLISQTRTALLQAIDQTTGHSDEARAALKALLVGEKQDLSPRIEENFQATGIYHVLVISGQHVAIMAVSLIWFFRLFPLPPIFRVALTILALVFYCLLAGGQSSILRATVMTTAFLL